MDSLTKAEQTAASLRRFSLEIEFGGADIATVYFDIESDQEDSPSWIVSEGLKVFYAGIEITALFDGLEIEEKIYEQSSKVDEMIEDEHINSMADYYHGCDE